MIALSYKEMRKQHFEELLKKAQRKLKYWEARLRKTRPNDMLHENVFKATDAGMECSFYKDALEALTANKWVSVEERLPDIDAEVLIYTDEGLYDVAQYSGGERFWTLERNPVCWVTASGVTHWMPLPEPPKE